MGSFVHFTKKPFVVEYHCQTLFLTKGVVFHYGYYNRFVRHSQSTGKRAHMLFFRMPASSLLHPLCQGLDEIQAPQYTYFRQYTYPTKDTSAALHVYP